MKMRSFRLAVVFAGLFLETCLLHSAAAQNLVKWEPHDFTFSGNDQTGNPFMVQLSAEFVSDNGTKLVVPGFYNGHGQWKIRMSPPSQGTWKLTTRSDIASLDKISQSFQCDKNPSPDAHGGLRVDSSNPHQFVFEDGTHYLPVGYECDWLWALDMKDDSLKTLDPFLDKLSADGFNLIVLNAYAHDTAWRKGKTSDDDFGPPALYAWEGSNEKPDHSRLNLEYWRHYDRVIQAMYDRGIIAHIFIKVYNKAVRWPANGTPEDDLYYRWLIARYSAYPNVTWDLAKEAHYEKDLQYKLGRLQLIRSIDPYHRLLTVHDDHATYNRGDYDKILDFRSDQQHTKWHQSILDHTKVPWPVINTEFGYEQGPNGPTDKTYGEAQSAEEVCRRAWEVYTAGGFGVYYYTYTAWDVVRTQDTPPGYAYFKHLSDFFHATDYWKLIPTPGLSSEGFCMANTGHEYIVFLNKGVPFTFQASDITVPLKAEWYQPYSGQRMPANDLANGTTQLQPPPGWSDVPVVLHAGGKVD